MITQYPFTSLILASFFIPSQLPASLPDNANNRPNILLVIADDMGLDASSCYNVGSQQVPMPNIQALCDSGMVFENAYAAPLCTPTRSTIISGEYGFRTGMGSAISRNRKAGLSTDIVSLFDVLKSIGYQSNIIGKWHLAGSEDGLDHPSKLGVPDYWGLLKGAVPDYFNWQATSQGKTIQVNEYATTAFTNKAIDWVQQQNTPWFLWLAYNAPHAPFHLPPKDLHSFDDLPDEKRQIRQNPLPYYNAMLEALDTEVGRLLAALSPEVRENTVVIFIGDNGSPNQVAKNIYQNHGAKGSLYEGGTHVPLIISGPNVLAGRTNAFANTTDLYSTILAMAGYNSQQKDSYTLLPALTGDNTERDYIYVEHFSDSKPKGKDVFGWAMRIDDYKYVAIDNKEPELYNLSNDPLEQTNLLLNGRSVTEDKIIKKIISKKLAIQDN